MFSARTKPARSPRTVSILERHVDVTNRDSEDVLRYAYMNSYYQTGLRNLLDQAILAPH